MLIVPHKKHIHNILTTVENCLEYKSTQQQTLFQNQQDQSSFHPVPGRCQCAPRAQQSTGGFDGDQAAVSAWSAETSGSAQKATG